jgi:hypothetical protein
LVDTNEYDPGNKFRISHLPLKFLSAAVPRPDPEELGACKGGNIVALAHCIGECAVGELIAMIPARNKQVCLIVSLAHAMHLGIRDQQIEMSDEVGDFWLCLKNKIAWAKIIYVQCNRQTCLIRLLKFE